MSCQTPMGPPAQTPSRNVKQSSSTTTPYLKTPSQLHRTPGEQLSSTPIISFDRIESQKENVQPLSRGRSAHALEKTFSLQQRERSTQLKSQRDRFESFISKLSNPNITREEEEELEKENENWLDDPLELWSDYIKWCSDSFPSGQSNESGLILLLERATREFKGTEKYRNDSRYLRIWLLYADNVEDSNQVHQFLFANEIGTNLATLYEGTAVAHEGRQRYDEADATYRLGIARRVENLDRLKRRYSDFKNRILSIQSQFPNSSDLNSTYSQALKQAMGQSNRSMLGTKVSGDKGRGETRSLSANSVRNFGGLGGLSKASSNSTSSIRGNPNGARLNVFVDGDDDEVSGAPAGKIPWSNLGSQNARTAENKQTISKMNGAIIKSKSSSTTGGKKLEVFKDSDDEDDEDQGKEESIANVESHGGGVDVFKSVNKTLSETDKVRKNPFMNWGQDVKLTPDEKDLSIPEASKATSEKPVLSTSRSKSSSNSKEKDSSSSSKKRTNPSNGKGKEKEPSSKRSKTSSSSSKPAAGGQERYAFPLQSLYPGMDVEMVTGGKSSSSSGKIHHPCGEISIDELQFIEKGLNVKSGETEDPWAYLDEMKGKWLPVIEKEKKPKETERVKEVSQSTSSPAVKKDKTKKKRKERLTDITSRSEFVSDTIRHNMLDPTEGMKKAMEDVQGMFNGDEDEDSEDDSDDQSEGEDEESDHLGRLMLSSNPSRMMETFNGEIPPTPTPLTRGGHSFSQAAHSTSGLPPLQFRNVDENGGVQATPQRNFTAKPNATPFGSSRQPLGGGGLGGLNAATLMKIQATSDTRQPLSSQVVGIPPPKVFAVHQDLEEEEEEDEEVKAKEEQIQPAQQVQSAPLLPRPSGARRVIAEEEDDEESSEDSGSESEGEGEVGVEGEGEEGYRHFRALSPITERTEHSKWTVASRTPGMKTPASNKTSNSGSLPIQEEDEEESIRKGLKISLVRDEEDSFESSDRTRETKNYSERYAATGFQDRPISNLTEGLTIASIAEDVSGSEEEEDEVVQMRASKSNRSLKSSSELYQIPNPCCPTSVKVISKILSELPLPLESSSDFVDLSSKSAQGKLEDLQKKAKQIARKSVGNTSSSSRAASQASQQWSLEINGCAFSVREKLGEGGYGAVFLAEDLDGAAPPRRKIIGGVNGDSSFENHLAELEVDSSEVINSDDEDEDDEEAERKKLVAVKVENPPNKWEFYILGQLRLRLMDSDLLNSIISARKFFCYKDESFLLLEYCSQGTLLEVVNSAKDSIGTTSSATLQGGASGNGGVEEHLAIFFVIELMKLVEGLHNSNIIHGDIKIDNCLLRLQDPPIGQTWSNSYTVDGSDGWSSKGITLIDFGRAIDLNRFKNSDGQQTFLADWETDEKDCLEMREGRPWTFETDYFGIASVAYCLLFGKYLSSTKDSQGKAKINGTLRRYWQTGIWTKIFEVLLNPKDEGELPITNQVKKIRQEMEAWLEINCNKGGKNLKGQLRKLEKWALK